MTENAISLPTCSPQIVSTGTSVLRSAWPKCIDAIQQTRALRANFT